MRNVIFLDVDGVLNSLPYSKYADEHNLPELDENSIHILGKIVKKYNAYVVLSSTWRQIMDTGEEMYDMLIYYLKKENIEIKSATKVIGLNRPVEIKRWIEENGMDGDKYLILDDDFGVEEYKEQKLDRYLIHTYFFCQTYKEGGLQERHLKEADKIFKSQEDEK